MIIIKNANLIDGLNIFKEVTDIVIEDGKVKSVGKIDETKYDCQVIDAKGRIVSPGIIDPHSHIGIWEESIGWEGQDVNEMTDPSTPHLRGIDAVYPYDVSFREALEQGVTSVCTGPGSANVIGGTFCALKTYGTNVEDMVIKEDIAMKMALGENPKRIYSAKKQLPSTRMGTAAMLRGELTKAKNYYDKVKKAEAEGTDLPKYDAKMEALCKVFDGLICKIHAHRSDDIQTAIRIGEEFNLNYSIEHCTEGHLVTDDLKKNNVPVIIGPVFGAKSKYELRNMTYKAAGILESEGIEFSIMTDHPVFALADTKAQTGLMIREGLSEHHAVKTMTSLAAKLNGIDDRVGSIKPGLDADIVIWSKDMFDILTHADIVMIDGVVRHNRLSE